MEFIWIENVKNIDGCIRCRSKLLQLMQECIAQTTESASVQQIRHMDDHINPKRGGGVGGAGGKEGIRGVSDLH